MLGRQSLRPGEGAEKKICRKNLFSPLKCRCFLYFIPRSFCIYFGVDLSPILLVKLVPQEDAFILCFKSASTYDTPHGGYIHLSQQRGGGGPSGGLLAHPLSWPLSLLLVPCHHSYIYSWHVSGSQTGHFLQPRHLPLNLRGQPVAGLGQHRTPLPSTSEEGACLTPPPKIQCLGDSVGSGNLARPPPHNICI